MKPKTTILGILENNIDSYSKSQKVLARVILTNYQKVAFQTIKRFSEFSGISEATIVRFVKLLKFEGYPEFQKELQRIIRADLKGNEKFKIAYDSKGGDDILLSDVINKEIDNLHQLQKVSDSKSMDNAIRSIKSAREVIIIGTRSSASLACHFAFGLSKLGIRTTRILSISSEEYDFIGRLNSESLVIVIDFPRYSNELLNIFDFCKTEKLKTIAITDSRVSPYAADINLYSPSESLSYIAFRSAPLSLITAIIIKLSMISKDETISSLSQFEKRAEAKKYFAKR
jgi:DNA-binding MurR/RpiR family transcriptional regulator